MISTRPIAFPIRKTGLLKNFCGTSPRFASTPASVRSNPDLYSQNCKERRYEKQANYPWQIVELHNRSFDIKKKGQLPRNRRKLLRSILKNPEKRLEALDSLRPEIQQLNAIILDCDQQLEALEKEANNLTNELPNLTHDETPRGEAPKVVEMFNIDLGKKLTAEDKSSRDHFKLGPEFGVLDFESASKISGSGHCNLTNEGGLLGQALIQYATSVALKHGFHYVEPPSMVYSDILAGCGFKPRDRHSEQPIYQIQQSESDKAGASRSHSLSATAEIPFAAIHAKENLSSNLLPLRIVGPSRCFRREAGAHGRRDKGLYRLHEFTKLEMFAWTTPDGDQEVFDSMMSVQSEIFQSLGFWGRVLEMPSVDLGASAYRKQDIEIYFPSRTDQNMGWGEVTSTSLCTDYQTSRLKTTLRGEEKWTHPHTVNGTAMAVPRVLAALLEYGYVREESIIKIPEVLWPFMYGITKIEKKGNKRA